MCHNHAMDTQDDTPQPPEASGISENDNYPFVKDIVPGRMSSAEVLQYWRENGVFEPWPQHEEIGEGKKYADSTEYVQAMRARADYRGC